MESPAEIMPVRWVNIPCPGCGETVNVVNELVVKGMSNPNFEHGCGYKGGLSWKNPKFEDTPVTTGQKQTQA